MHLLRTIPKIILFILLAIGVQRFCHRQTDGFALYKVQSSLSYNPDWDISISDQDLARVRLVLNQPFYYLGKGAQCYVFVSQDDQYVLKLFRLYHLRPPFWITSLRFPFSLENYRLKKIAAKEHELAKDFESYKIAYKDLKEETGLLFEHLNKTTSLGISIDLYDKIGVHHRLDLDSTEFLLQKKASLFYPSLEAWIQEGNLQQAQEVLSDLVAYLAARAQKGIFDKDPDINTNFGICQGKLIQIDVGRFRKDPSRKNPSTYREDIIRITDHLHQWLEEKEPSLDRHLQQEINNLDRSCKDSL